MFCRPRFLQFSLSRYQKIHIKTNSKTLLIINRECFLVRNNYALNLDLNTTRSIISITNKNNETIPRKFAFFILSLFKFERGNFLLLNIVPTTIPITPNAGHTPTVNTPKVAIIKAKRHNLSITSGFLSSL